MTVRGTLGGAALAILIVSRTDAQDLKWYGAVDLGGFHQNQMNAYFDPPVSPGFDNAGALRFHFSYVTFGGFARAGYHVTRHIRVEVEGGYRLDRLKSAENLPERFPIVDLCNPARLAVGGCQEPNGAMNGLTGMANILVDILPTWRVDPFIGVGVGVMNIGVQASGILVNGTTNEQVRDYISDSSTRFSYQAIGGFSVRASRRINVDLTYRYQSGPEISFVNNDETDNVSSRLRGRYDTNGVTLGVRYGFGAR